MEVSIISYVPSFGLRSVNMLLKNSLLNQISSNKAKIMLYVNLFLFSHVTWAPTNTISDIISNLLLICSVDLIQFKISHIILCSLLLISTLKGKYIILKLRKLLAFRRVQYLNSLDQKNGICFYTMHF